jgi:mono/diheme cytochrome c family protein
MDNCRTCHGAAGKPTHMALTQYPKIPSFADTTLMRGLSEDSIVAVLQHGLGKDMRSFKQKLTPAEMVAVARFVRTLAGSPGKTP